MLLPSVGTFNYSLGVAQKASSLCAVLWKVDELSHIILGSSGEKAIHRTNM